ncbi:MAG: GntR family transcriptional regulator [Firmicutes bacterium]|jgi:DNA-binding GntR family transcriptional regulator|nr:GntR family transcriptional regulator [Bacillota bacterium]
MFSPLAHRLDLLVQRYREAILTKRLKPGQEIRFEEEARSQNVPLPLMRSCFRQLANMGLVELRPGGRAVIRTNNIQSLQSLEFGMTRRRA